ncbi:hypothetical protein LTR05_005897 [Lithohypha guttulata]|uniref:J domain-containing protein n=1 Tax=Lithohypha guttulata TaxID=1690604 RepID=A0AAN7T023_9EURO|nr:hypothetical protein LTR05_005897 [Lithohypha guttulata]
MVKADYKRDYYADLDLPSTADSEVIKKRFRELAKQYHPDRNPGRELDVVPKFQAIQAAHEILGDPIQKVKYDSERAKLRATDSPLFKKPPTPRRTDSAYQNGAFPPRRDASTNRYAPQATRPRPNSASASTADKFAQFARAAPQQWDRSKFEQAARDEGLRGMNAMRGSHAQTSPLRTRHPTAPKPDPYSDSPGFPGLNRTTSSRRYTPGDSAYAHVYGSDRPSSTAPFNHDPNSRVRESLSPLRQTKSFHTDDSHLRPGLARNPSRYAQTSGERINVNTTNVGRSASVRVSPVDKVWEDREQGPFGSQRSPNERAPQPRHRSHSPKARYEYASETSSDEDDIPPPQDRKKASLRRPHTHAPNSNSPGLTDYFPKNNYTRIVEEDIDTYNYPAPDNKGPPTRRPFAYVSSPADEPASSVDETTSGAPSEEDARKKYVYPGEWPNSYPNTERLSTIHEDPFPSYRFDMSPLRGSNIANVYCSDKAQSAKFSAERWHEQFENHADLLHPPESILRKSPTKPFRTSQRGQTRGFVGADTGVKYFDPSDKGAAFQPGKLAADFASQVNSARRSSRSEQPSSNGTASDEMDVDSPAPASTESPAASEEPYNVTAEEETSPASEKSPRQHTHRHHSDPHGRTNGFNLTDLESTIQPKTGLKDLNSLSDTLPFTSRPAPGLETFPSSALRDLNLPRPPKPPYCPVDAGISQGTWDRFGAAMTTYMHEWNKFNAAMIEHFRARQEVVTHGMYRNWVCAQGDGASAESFEASKGKEMAGYATYMTWLEDDRKCRAWWDVAFEDHRVCMEGLGRVRRRVKELNSQGV